MRVCSLGSDGRVSTGRSLASGADGPPLLFDVQDELQALVAMRAAGIKVIPVVPTVRHALRVEAEGADAIVASGTDGGGHVGLVATLPLVPQVVDAVKVPVIAAGGIGDARGFLAALSLGAVGAQLGTRLICTTEAEDPGWYKEAILRTGEEGTIISKALTGKTTRAFATPEILAYEEARLSGASADALKQYQRAVRAGRKQGADYKGNRQAVVGQILQPRSRMSLDADSAAWPSSNLSSDMLAMPMMA